jgi:hypothetical protein
MSSVTNSLGRSRKLLSRILAFSPWRAKYSAALTSRFLSG